jgi:ketopantoate reductase
VLVILRKNQVADLLTVLTQNKSPNIVFISNNLSGPEELTKSLGWERVMMGAVYAAGKQDGSVIRAMVSRLIAAPFGEIDGTISPRLKQIIDVFH